MHTLAWILIGVATVYALIGLAFALFFVARGVNRVDPAAAEGTIGFRILILPGTVALWPLMMRRYQEGAPSTEAPGAYPGSEPADDDESTQPVVGEEP